MVVAVGVAAVWSTSACGGDTATHTPPTTSSTSGPAADPSTTSAPTPTTPPTTVAVPSMSFPTPKAAADLLFAAWTAQNRSAADSGRWAPTAELDKLFAAAVIPTPKNRGCDDGLGGMSQCFIANGNGGIDIDLVGGPAGWTVETITPFAGG